ncbi:probable terpene synthase 11 [Mercurialis annua]|uniref:probable terpene synthase 11 n=1 Tax=Mercurialis annua TaxID=3986 RepID=UPI0021607500|nr:probable terpene synthase 11 [Mercurialis annua]
MSVIITKNVTMSCPKVPLGWRSRSYQATPCMHFNSATIKCRISTIPNRTRKADQKPKSLEELRECMRKELVSSSSPTTTLKLIDSIQRIGVGYHLEEEINTILEKSMEWNAGEDLFSTALRFRLLRHNGFPAQSDVFRKFMNKDGKFKESLRKEASGMVSLHEASYLGTVDEDELVEAMEFTRSCIGLDVPRHLRMPRLEARNYIHHYSLQTNNNITLKELAILDYNHVQSLHRNELDEIVRWWKQLGLVEKLGFGRDRPLECYLWTVGIFPEPYNSICRIELTKTIAILLVIDDIFDTYGSLPDLILFTDAIRRWDLNAMESLPEYMKICYMALYNTTNDIAYIILKQHGFTIVSHLKKTWIDMFEAFLVEAKWFNNGYVATLEEYLHNGVTTGGTYMALVHSFFLMGRGLTHQTAAMMQPYPPLFSFSGRILRLWDDLGTAREEQERGGDVASSIECLMREKNISNEEEGRKQVRQVIRSLWRELNGEVMGGSAMPLSIKNASLNLARTAQVIYQHADDNNGSSVDDQVQKLIYRPIPLLMPRN